MAKLAARTQNVMKTFLQRATETKIDRLSSLVTESFRYLLRKKSLVKEITIHPHTFDIKLFDAEGTVVSKQRFLQHQTI